MAARIGLWTLVGLLLAVGPAVAQTVPNGQLPPQEQPAGQPGDPQYVPPQNPGGETPPGQMPPGQYPAAETQGPQVPAGPNQVQPFPTLQRRVPRQPPAPPFVLTPQQEEQLDMVLQAWEENSKRVKTFECKFQRFEYGPKLGDANADPNAPRFVDEGEIKYAAPDKGLFRVEGQRPEQWICDGQSIFEYDYQQKRLVEHKLPPDLQGKAIADGPLPFLFGAEAAKLRQRYFLRIASQPAQNEIWLEARPKFQKDAANFRRADLILKDMQPFALQTHLPNGTDRTSYRFENIRINERRRDLLDPLEILKKDWFRAATPRGWQKIVQEPQPAQPIAGPPQIGRQPGFGIR